jgi:hypothetical protein
MSPKRRASAPEPSTSSRSSCSIASRQGVPECARPRLGTEQPAPSGVAQPSTQLFQLPSELLLDIAKRVPVNQRSLVLRTLCTESRRLLHAETRVDLSQALPVHAFAAGVFHEYYRRPGVADSLTRLQRHSLALNAAAAGCDAGFLAELVSGPAHPLHTVQGLSADVISAAASTGQLALCKELYALGWPWDAAAAERAAANGHYAVVSWLLENGSPVADGQLLSAAAAGGQLGMCERLLADGVAWAPAAAGAAARSGHAAAMWAMLRLRAESPSTRPVDVGGLLAGAAYGLGLEALLVSATRSGRPMRALWARACTACSQTCRPL